MTCMGNLYLVRHGQTTCNADGIIQGPRVDSDLSAAGRAQAAALGDAFGETALDAVFTSPLRRARETAAALVATHEADLVARVVPEMYEMDYGALCGQRMDDVQDQITHILDAWSMGFTSEAFPDGESPVLTQHRVRRFAQGLREAAARRDVAIVAHGRVNRILVATLTGAALSELERFPQDNANITHLAVDGDGVRAVRINDTSHLDGDGHGSFS